MARLIKKKIAFSRGKYKFNIELKSPITIILGNSSTGKTLFYNMLNEYSIDKSIESFTFINGLKNKGEVEALLSIPNRINIIDNADIILNKPLSFYEKSNNQYIILGRMIEKYSLKNESIAVMVNKDNTFKLMYPMIAKE